MKRYFFGYVVDTNVIISTLLLMVVALGAGFYAVRLIKAIISKHQLRVGTRIYTLVNSEELILEITPRLKHLEKSIRNLRLPDHHIHPMFGDRVVVIDLKSNVRPRLKENLLTVDVTTMSWRVAVSGQEVLLNKKLGTEVLPSTIVTDAKG